MVFREALVNREATGAMESDCSVFLQVTVAEVQQPGTSAEGDLGDSSWLLGLERYTTRHRTSSETWAKRFDYLTSSNKCIATSNKCGIATSNKGIATARRIINWERYRMAE